jgi:type VI secretion system protein ImpA
MPTQIDNAAFQIGAEQIFELPVGRLPNETGEPSAMDYPSQNAGAGEGENGAQPADAEAPPYSVRSRSEAIALLDQVHRFFRGAEPSSPVPMLCERARALAERDFMGVLRDVLPKNAFKNPGADR